MLAAVIGRLLRQVADQLDPAVSDQDLDASIELPRRMRSAFTTDEARAHRGETALSLMDRDLMGWAMLLVRSENGASRVDVDVALESDAIPAVAYALTEMALADLTVLCRKT